MFGWVVLELFKKQFIFKNHLNSFVPYCIYYTNWISEKKGPCSRYGTRAIHPGVSTIPKTCDRSWSVRTLHEGHQRISIITWFRTLAACIGAQENLWVSCEFTCSHLWDTCKLYVWVASPCESLVFLWLRNSLGVLYYLLSHYLQFYFILGALNKSNKLN